MQLKKYSIQRNKKKRCVGFFVEQIFRCFIDCIGYVSTSDGVLASRMINHFKKKKEVKYNKLYNICLFERMFNNPSNIKEKKGSKAGE